MASLWSSGNNCPELVFSFLGSNLGGHLFSLSWQVLLPAEPLGSVWGGGGACARVFEHQSFLQELGILVEQNHPYSHANSSYENLAAICFSFQVLTAPRPQAALHPCPTATMPWKEAATQVTCVEFKLLTTSHSKGDYEQVSKADCIFQL